MQWQLSLYSCRILSNYEHLYQRNLTTWEFVSLSIQWIWICPKLNQDDYRSILRFLTIMSTMVPFLILIYKSHSIKKFFYTICTKLRRDNKLFGLILQWNMILLHVTQIVTMNNRLTWNIHFFEGCLKVWYHCELVVSQKDRQMLKKVIFLFVRSCCLKFTYHQQFLGKAQRIHICTHQHEFISNNDWKVSRLIRVYWQKIINRSFIQLFWQRICISYPLNMPIDWQFHIRLFLVYLSQQILEYATTPFYIQI